MLAFLCFAALIGNTKLCPLYYPHYSPPTDEFSPQLSRKSLVRQRLSNLQDIVEEDEDIANGDVIPPPQKVELDRQLVEGSGYSVVIKWEPPAPLPPSATGYNVYVNGDFRANMEGAYQKNVFLSDIPRQQVRNSLMKRECV